LPAANLLGVLYTGKTASCAGFGFFFCNKSASKHNLENCLRRIFWACFTLEKPPAAQASASFFATSLQASLRLLQKKKEAV
jgi:hypothetical protein